jgi:hypothetical protein
MVPFIKEEKYYDLFCVNGYFLTKKQNLFASKHLNLRSPI